MEWDAASSICQSTSLQDRLRRHMMSVKRHIYLSLLIHIVDIVDVVTLKIHTVVDFFPATQF